MSEILILQYNEFIQSRKVKLINVLVSEIIFLKANFNRAENRKDLNHLKYALEKLEDFLIKLKSHSSEMQENDFDEILLVTYRFFKDIAMNLE